MLIKTDAKDAHDLILQDLYEQSLSQMMNGPDLTEARNNSFCGSLKVEEKEPMELPEGAEPLSETIIRMPI